MKTALLICLVAFSGVLSTPTGKSSGAYYGGGYSGQQQAQPAGAGQQYFNQGQDGSYSYGYNTGTGAFQAEQKTPGGQVSGKYGHTGPDGSFVNVEYQAANTGGSGQGRGQYPEVAVGRVAPAAPSAPGYGAPAAVQTQYTTGTRYAQTSAVAPAPVPSGPSRPVESAAFNLERKPDGSYSYSYSSSDSSKTETGTADGQVQGSFNFRGDDGVQRTVGYTAGQQGFLATGAHLPTTDDGTPAAGTSTGGGFPAYNVAPGSAQLRYAGRNRFQSDGYGYEAPQQHIAPVASQSYSAGGVGGYGGAKNYQHGGSRVGYSRLEESVDESPKPFAFNYNAGDHGRQESQDASGVVRGSYVVNSPDGSQKELTYQADDSGFHIINEKQVQSGSVGAAASYPSSGAAAAGQATYATGRSLGSGFAYKPKSIHAASPAHYR